MQLQKLSLPIRNLQAIAVLKTLLVTFQLNFHSDPTGACKFYMREV